MYSDEDADLSWVQERNVAVLGFGPQGRAQALSLRDSGVDVRVGLPESSPAHAAADVEGLRVLSPYAACEEADLIAVLAPRAARTTVFAAAVRPNLVAGDAVVFDSGFDVRFGAVPMPPGVDVCMVAPQSPASQLRAAFESGRGVPVLVAVEQDASGAAWALTLSYAKALGGTRAGALRTTFAEATEAALFARSVAQAARAMVEAGFDVLLEAGYQPELAYLQCFSGSSPDPDVQHAALLDGTRIVDASVREGLRTLLTDVVEGAFETVPGAQPRGPSRRAAVERELTALLGWPGEPGGAADAAQRDHDEPQAWLT
jgi:ketol-acid reductoisomerase